MKLQVCRESICSSSGAAQVDLVRTAPAKHRYRDKQVISIYLDSGNVVVPQHRLHHISNGRVVTQVYAEVRHVSCNKSVKQFIIRQANNLLLDRQHNNTIYY